VYDQAIRDHNEVVRLKPEVGSYTERGVAFERMRDYDRAIRDYISAIQLDPEFAGIIGVFNALGDAYRAQGTKDWASDYRKLLNQYPNNTAAQEALRRLGQK
jgi:tetratricopeptide (TPR) repeat protein